MQRKIKTRNRVISLCLVVVTILTLGVNILSSAFSKTNTTPLVMTASADSNDRRRALISFARNRNLQELTEDGLTSLTNEDLTMIGIFLSNFYVPWSTSIKSTSQGHDDAVEKMVDALVSCNFDKDVARVLVEMVFNLSEKTHEQLYVAYDEKNWKCSSIDEYNTLEIDTSYDLKKGKTGNTVTREATWADFLALCSGCCIDGRKNVKTVKADEVTDGNEATVLTFMGGYKDTPSMYLGWVSDNGLNLVFSASDALIAARESGYKGLDNIEDIAEDMGVCSARDFTPATLQYAVLSSRLNYAKGLAGNALFQCSRKDLLQFSKSDREKLFVGNFPLSIDCFGNIIADCGSEAYIVIPAAANPHTWRQNLAKAKSGEVDIFNPDYINMVNMYDIAYAANGMITSTKGGISVTLDTGANESLVDPYMAEPGESIFKTGYFAVCRGNSETAVDNKWVDSEDIPAMQEIIDSNSLVKQWFFSNSAGDTDKVYFPRWLGYGYTGLFTLIHSSQGYFEELTGSYSQEGVGEVTTAAVTQKGFTDFIMINTLGDLDNVAKFYTTSVTDLGVAQDESADDDETAASLSTDGQTVKSIFNTISYKMMTQKTLGANGWQDSAEFDNWWNSVNYDVLAEDGITKLSAEKFKKAVDAAVNHNYTELTYADLGIPSPNSPADVLTADATKQSIINVLKKMLLNVYDADSLYTYIARLDSWRSSASYSSDVAILKAQKEAEANKSDSDDGVAGGLLVVADLFNSDGQLISDLSGSGIILNSFESVGADDNAVTSLPAGLSKQYAVSIYLSYVYAYFGGADNPLSWEYNSGVFPELTDDLIDWGDIEIDNSEEKDIMLKSMIYYLAHPTEGIEYVKVWFKNKVGGILAGWHEDMAGASHTTATTGATRYVGFMGYVTTPQLHDLTWTDWLLTQYDSLIVYFIIIMMVILLLYVLVGTLTVQKAIAGLAIFAICAFLPPKAINTTVDISNRVCDSLYGSKFTYWALVQHEQYISKITEAVSTKDNDQYLASIFNEQAANAADDYAIVTVKWMCPKKDNYMANIEKQLEQTTADNHAFRLISGLVRNNVSGEDYLDSADSLYLYRSYSDISVYSNYGYKQSKIESDKVSLGESNAGTGLPFDGYDSVTWANYINYYADAAIVPTSGSEVFNNISGAKSYYSLVDGMNLGFELSDINANGVYDKRDSMRYYAFLKSAPLDKAVKNGLSTAQLSELTLSPDTIEQTLAGISQKDMDFGLHDISNVLVSTAGADYGVTADQLGDFVYANYTESPFYYFSYNLNDQLSSASKRASSPVTDYKGLFLAGDEYSYFYNMAESSSLISGSSATGTVLGYPGYGQLRDYMDMRTLFCVVIPRLKQANDVVVDWDNTYGLTLYEDVPIKYLPDGSFDIPQEVIDAGIDSELAYKYWHNANVVQLFNMYTPWVDTMYDCDYAKEQSITVNGEKFIVRDPLNPYSYFEKTQTGMKGRPMIFSRSEMEFFGLRWKDLTTVEQKIIEVQDNCYETLLQLIDYYNFNEEVLNTGAAMLETFEFNKVFSQTSVVGEDYILYPQSYELKNFSYDAYLRLMLSNSTGESIASGVAKTDLNKTGSFYQDVIGKSSIMTGIMLIVVDLFAVYAVPALKMGFIVMLFFLSVLVILAASISLEIKIQNVLLKSLVFPLLKFLGISIGMAFLVSLFMSDGNTAVTNRKSITISLGDPVMLLIVMLVINAGVLILYAKLCKSVFDDVKKYFQAVGSSIVGTFGGAFAKIASAATVATTGKAAYTSAQAMGGIAPSRGSINDAVRTPRAIGLGGASGMGSNDSSESGSRSSNISLKPSQGASVDRATRRLNKARAKDNKYEAKLARGRAKIRNREFQDAYDKRVFNDMKQAKLDKLNKRHSAGKIDDAEYNEAKSKIENTKFKSRYGGITSVPRGIGRSAKQVVSRKIHGESAGAKDLRYSLYTSKSLLNSAKTRYKGAKRNYKVVKKFGKRI